MAGDWVRIAQFWQAVEIFSPQPLPRFDPGNHVAVTRAKRRLYVIGNHETWGSERYFSALKDPAILAYYLPPSR